MAERKKYCSITFILDAVCMLSVYTLWDQLTVRNHYSIKQLLGYSNGLNHGTAGLLWRLKESTNCFPNVVEALRKSNCRTATLKLENVVNIWQRPSGKSCRADVDLLGERGTLLPHVQLQPVVTPVTKRYHNCSSMLPPLPEAPHEPNPLLKPLNLDTQQRGIIHEPGLQERLLLFQLPIHEALLLTHLLYMC